MEQLFKNVFAGVKLWKVENVDFVRTMLLDHTNYHLRYVVYCIQMG